MFTCKTLEGQTVHSIRLISLPISNFDMPEQTDTPQHNNELTVDKGGDLDRFLQTLRTEFSGYSGNQSLRIKLGWDNDPDRYWAAHGKALERGEVTMGKGRGGSVRLADLIEDSGSESVDQIIQDPSDSSGESQRFSERHLYPGARKAIEGGWVKAQRYDDHRSEITASMGRAETGGKWSRPDIAVLATKSFPYFPGRQFDIITFEIKPSGQTDIQGVFESLSHQQFANKAYILFHLEDRDIADNFAEKQPNADRILGTAKKHGVGLIITTDIADFDTWEELVPAERHIPDPDLANRFITKCFSDDVKNWIIKLHKSLSVL